MIVRISRLGGVPALNCRMRCLVAVAGLAVVNSAVLFGDESRNPLGYLDKAQRDIAACIDLLHAKLGQDPALSRCDFSAVNIPSFTQGAEDLRSSRRLHVLGIEVQVARTTTEFENFCTKKIMRKIVAVRARAVSPELEPVLPDLLEPRVVASRISSLTGHCRRSVMFTPIASGVGIDWVVGFREDRDWALRAVARVLQVLQSVHKLGITLNGRGRFVISGGKDLDSIQLADVADATWFKNSFGSYVNVVDLSAKSDLLMIANQLAAIRDAMAVPAIVSFVESVRRLTMSGDFEYTFWIDAFHRTAAGDEFVELPKVLYRHRVMEAPAVVRKFLDAEAACMQEPETSEEECDFLFEEWAIPPSSARYASDGDSITKIFGDESACSERSMLLALDGLHGLAPKVGSDEDFVRVLREVEPHSLKLVEERLFRRTDVLISAVVRLLETLRNLHDAGMVHRDVRLETLVFSKKSDVAGTLMLVGYGSARPFVDADGFHLPRVARKYDLLGVVHHLAQRVGREVPAFVELFLEVDAMPTEARPDYERWIRILTKLALQ